MAGLEEQMIPIEQDVEYYHVRHCECGSEVFHDGMRSACECNSSPAFQCASCKPYEYEDLILRGDVRPVSNLLETAVLFSGWGAAMIIAFAWWVTK